MISNQEKNLLQKILDLCEEQNLKLELIPNPPGTQGWIVNTSLFTYGAEILKDALEPLLQDLEDNR